MHIEMNDIIQKIEDIMSNMGLPSNNYKSISNFNLLELVIEIEDNFDVDLEDEKFFSCKTIEDLATIIYNEKTI